MRKINNYPLCGIINLIYKNKNLIKNIKNVTPTEVEESLFYNLLTNKQIFRLEDSLNMTKGYFFIIILNLNLLFHTTGNNCII